MEEHNILINRGKSNEDIARRYAEYLKQREQEKNKPKPKVKQETIITPSTNIQNPESYLILEGRTHGNYSYPDLLVSMEKYHHNKDWNTCQEVLHKGNAFMLTIRQFVDFIKLLKTGKAFNGKGKQADKATLDKILDEILTVRSPWRVEWLDAKFSRKGRQLQIAYHKIGAGGLKQVTEPLETCLMTDKTPGIYLDYWLRNATYQGLPTKKTSKGNIWYWYPKENYVAGFGADSGRAGLYCSWSPEYSNSALGVRIARIK